MKCYYGQSVSPGYAVAKVWKLEVFPGSAGWFAKSSDTLTELTAPMTDARGNPAPVEFSEVLDAFSKIEEACNKVRGDLHALTSAVAQRANAEVASSLEAQCGFLEDEEVFTFLRQRLPSLGIVGAIRALLLRWESLFSAMSSSEMRRRWIDFQDVWGQVLYTLVEEELEVPWWEGLREESVLVVEELLPSALARLDTRLLRGIVAARGSSMDHTAMLARALGIPYIVDVFDVVLDAKDGDRLALDAVGGTCWLEPDAVTQRKFEALQRTLDDEAEEAPLPQGSCFTRCGTSLRLAVNVGFQHSLTEFPSNLSLPIGLVRTELAWMERGAPLLEDEQISLYRSIWELAGKRSVTFRLFDWGGDKQPVGLTSLLTAGLLPWRGVRWLLEEQEQLRRQVRALLLASQGRTVQILLPFVSVAEEIWEIREIIAWEARELGLSQQTPLFLLGIMIETPASVVAAKSLFAHVDFACVGTNDLLPLLFGVERSHPDMASFLTPAHPVLWKSMRQVIEASLSQNTPLTFCGELAGIPRWLPFLVGLGVRSLSVALPCLRRLAAQAELFEVSEAQEWSKTLLTLQSARSVEEWAERIEKRLAKRRS